jgi:UDP-glucose 4-epimerase
MTTVLITGGAGFIGSHTCAELLSHGYDVIVADDFSNSTPQVFERIQELTGRRVGAVYGVDICGRRALTSVFEQHHVDAVVHFAARKAVGESTRMPVEYYDTNVGGTTNLLRTMYEHGVHRLVYSSSCSIYGDAGGGPLDEATPARPTNPYAASKWACEQILADVCRRCPEFTVVALRYFNPVGAHPSGLLGEDARGVPANLMPYLAQVAVGRLARIDVFGDDYATADGTAVRDYIHVVDTARAHRIALDRIMQNTLGTQDTQDRIAGAPDMRVYNLGVGRGRTVLEVIEAFGAACGRPIPYRIVSRRPGDVPELVADATAVARAWGWHPTRDLDAMCQDAWRFQRLNPDGYARRQPAKANPNLNPNAKANDRRIGAAT